MIVKERCLFILIISCLKTVNSYQLSSFLQCSQVKIRLANKLFIIEDSFVCLVHFLSQDPGVVGVCLQNQTKWTFVKKFGCYSFQYSGCGGNQNNFLNKQECVKICIEEDISLASEGMLRNSCKGRIYVMTSIFFESQVFQPA